MHSHIKYCLSLYRYHQSYKAVPETYHSLVTFSTVTRSTPPHYKSDAFPHQVLSESIQVSP